MTTRSRSRYPSDLTDAQWSKLHPLLPEAHTSGRHRTVEHREIANAINYRWETGCVWRMLPHDFPPWGTVYAYFRHWQRAGVIRHLREILLEPRTKSQPRTAESFLKTPPAWPPSESSPGRVFPSTSTGEMRPKEDWGDTGTPSIPENERRTMGGFHTSPLTE